MHSRIRNRLLLILLIVISGIHGFCVAQELDEELFYFHVTINNPTSLTITPSEDGMVSVENPADPKETGILNSYDIYEFEPTFSGTLRADLKKVYRIVTNDVNLMSRLWSVYPKKYEKVDQFYPNEAAYYPNDYGTTSPVENLGANHPLTDLDLINAPGAWGISQGSKKVVIGISDAKIDSTNIDLEGKISKYLKYFNNRTGLICSHGTNVAGIAGAAINNGYGRPGLCSGCDMITNSYGSFKFIEELVAAGARVINASWARCNMGQYHEEIEKRINELYEQGVIIVAGAGNSKNCNRDGFAPDDYAYPASYDKVISVTGVFSRFDSLEDSVYVDTDGYRTAARVKDRHAKLYALPKNGKVIPKFVTLNMQFNDAIDICAPAHSYLLGNKDCELPEEFGGATSSTAPYITGVIGLMWSVNYCLDAYETESILKLTSVAIDHLPGNERYIGKLGAGRVDAYKAVKMARDMKEIMGTVTIENRDFYRFDFRLKNSPYDIVIQNQTFRDSAIVDFKARNKIVLKPGTRLAPDNSGNIRLAIDPGLPTLECYPSPPKVSDGIIDELNKAKQESRVNVNRRFLAKYNLQQKQIRINANSNIPMEGMTAEVKIISPDNIVLKEHKFQASKGSEIPFDFEELSQIVVEITVGGTTDTIILNRRR